MTLSKLPYKGTRDFFPTQMRVREFIFNKIHDVAKKFCFEPYDGPLIEEVDLYKAKSGEELINEQIYSFVDRGERLVAIRPEMTPTLARMVAQIHREYPKPIRWYSIPNLMRYEKPQKGRLREHWQFNADIFGADEPYGEAEIIHLIVSLFQSFGASQDQFEICLNDRRIVDATFNDLLKISKETSYRLYKIIDKSKKVSPEALDKMINEQLDHSAKNIFLDYLNIKNFQELEAFCSQHQLTDKIQGFIQLINVLKSWNLISFCKYDPTIVRGLDYYTGMVFEVFDRHPENRRALCGGGAYSNLLQIFNESPLHGVGVGMGDVTLADFLTAHQLYRNENMNPFDLLVCYLEADCESSALSWANCARDNNLHVELFLGPVKIKKVLQYADKKGFKGILIIGADEKSKDVLPIKNLKTRTETMFAKNQLSQLRGFLC